VTNLDSILKKLLTWPHSPLRLDSCWLPSAGDEIQQPDILQPVDQPVEEENAEEVRGLIKYCLARVLVTPE